MLDACTDPALGAVRSRLRPRQRMVAAPAPMNTAPKAAGLELHLGLGRAIGAVAEHICRRVALGQERVERLAVVDRRIGHLVAPDQLVLGVRIHVVLVAKEALAVLLRPAGVAVLLAQFGGLLLPGRGVSPTFTVSFSSRLLRCFGTGTIVASTICPPRAMYPFAFRCSDCIHHHSVLYETTF